jgi:iron complex outermembrane receptor protein
MSAQDSRDDHAIVVTARKRDESQLDVPLAITAVSGETLERRGIFSVDAISRIAPSVRISDAGGSPQGGLLTIRGFTGPENVIVTDQAVSFNIDGVQVARAAVRRMSQMDISSIEVLKGPQTLFYGKNSPAGVISIHTADPTRDLEAKGSLGYEVVGRQVVGDGYVSGPLSDTLGARIAVYGSRMDGWAKDTTPDGFAYSPADHRGPEQKEWAVRGTLRWQPDDTFDARLKVNYGSIRGDGWTTNVQRIDCPSPAGPFGGVPDNCKADNKYIRGSLGPNFSAIEPNYGNGRPYLKQDQTLAGLEMNYKLGEKLTITSQSGLYHVNFLGADSLSLTPTNPLTSFVSLTHLRISELSQELRLTSDFDGNFDIMLGGFYQHGRVKHLARGLVNATAPTAIGNAYLDFDSDAYSAFGQVLLRPIDEVELGIGGRYSHERKHIKNTLAGVTLTPVTLGETSKGWSNFSPDFSITYRPTKDVSIYSTYRQGFLSGGFNTGNVSANGANALYDQQTAKGFEAGIKSNLVGGRLTANLALYDYTVRGLLVSRVLESGVTVAQNAGKVSLKGVELDLQYKVANNLRLRGALGYNRARYADFITPCWRGQTIANGCNLAPNAAGAFTLQDLHRKVLAHAPAWTGNLGASHDVPLGSDLKLSFTGDMSYADAYFTDTPNTPAGKMPSQAVFDASVRLSDGGDRWQAALIGTNLTNKYSWDRSYGATFGGGGTGTNTGNPTDTYALISRGRQVMLRLTYKLD